MYSFYGGRPGNSFLITKTYESYDQMVNDFKSNNCEVHFDEHVLIDCSNRNNKDHGKIYRRGYDIANEDGGAIYIGNITGPAGPPPNLEIGQYTDLQPGNPENKQFGNFKLISGQESPYVKWCSYSTTNENNTDKTTYVGVQIPYPVFDFSVKGVSPYAQDGTILNVDTARAVRKDDESNPFYYNMEFEIPAGLNGATIDNLTATQEIINNTPTNYYIFSYDYTPVNQPTITRQFRLGPIQQIKSVYQVSNVVVIQFIDGTTKQFSIAPVGVVNNVTFDKMTGTLTVVKQEERNENPTRTQTIIPIIDSVDVYDNNKIQIKVKGENNSLQTITTPHGINDITKLTDIQINKDSNNNDKLWKRYNGNWIEVGLINKISNIDVRDKHIWIERNSNTWEDLGSLYEYQNDTIENIKWIGTGELTKTNNNASLEFYIPLNISIPPLKNYITIVNGSIEYEYESIDSNDEIHKNIFEMNSFANVTISNTLTGLHFIIPSVGEIEEAPIKNGTQFVNLKINYLNLQLDSAEFSNRENSFDRSWSEEELEPLDPGETAEEESEPPIEQTE